MASLLLDLVPRTLQNNKQQATDTTEDE